MSDGGMLGRRRLLVGSVALLGVGASNVVLTGCGEDEAAPVTLEADPVRLDSLASELDLIAAYEQTIAMRPDLAASLTPIAEQHRLHAEELAAGQPLDVSGRTVSVPGTVADLQERERQAAGLRAGACVRSQNPELAEKLSLIGASEAQHVVALAALT